MLEFLELVSNGNSRFYNQFYGLSSLSNAFLYVSLPLSQALLHYEIVALDYSFKHYTLKIYTLYVHIYRLMASFRGIRFNTLRPRQNGRLFADDTFNRIFVNENDKISIEFSLKFVPQGPINNIPALVQKMAWRRPGDKPLYEPVMVSLLTHICVTRPQWVNHNLYCIGFQS